MLSKFINLINLIDGGKGFGDFSNVGKFVSIEEGAKHIKRVHQRLDYF